MWWILSCFPFADCNVGVERADGWRIEAALVRQWTPPNHNSIIEGVEDRPYASHESCMAALRDAMQQGDHHFSDWTGARHHIIVTHHADFIERHNPPFGHSHFFACFSTGS